MEARDNILRAIGEKLSEMQGKGCDLAKNLDMAYEHRMKKLEGITLPVADQRVDDKNKTKADAA